jgi:TPP-dependent 2-oxoacid decarboxylase
MQEALAEAIEMINSSKQPVIIAGVEIHRFALQGKLRILYVVTAASMNKSNALWSKGS